MKKSRNVKGRFKIFILFLIIITTALIFISLLKFNLVSTKQTLNQIKNTSIPEEINVQEGEQNVTIVAGRTTINLPSRATIRLNGNNAYDVPELMFSNKYTQEIYTPDEVSNINQLEIKNKVIMYQNGYINDIQRVNCNKEEYVNIDYQATRVTDCSLIVKISKSAKPTLSDTSFARQLSVAQDVTISGKYSIEPLLYLSSYGKRLTRNVAGEYYIEPGDDWRIYFITNYGIKTLRYSPIDLSSRKNKSINIGPAQIMVTINNVTCNPPYLNNGSCDSASDKRIGIFNKVDFTVLYKKMGEDINDFLILDYVE